MSAEQQKAFLFAVRNELAPDFRQRKSGLFTSQLTGRALGWVGLNTAHYRNPASLAVNPVMGVHHIDLEREVRRLAGPADSATTATISQPIGYLMPEREFRQWRLTDESDMAEEASSLGRAVSEFGLPFMRAHTELSQLIDALQRHHHPGRPARDILRITALAMDGRLQEAHRVGRSYATSLGGDETMAALHFRRFFERFQVEWTLG
jgi:hypothetical protein